MYRVLFFNHDDIYEIYARSITVESQDFLGFVELSEMMFDDTQTNKLGVSEKRLKEEFKRVKRAFIPLQSVIRIDEVERDTPSELKQADKKGNIRQFPGRYLPPEPDKE